MPRTGHGPQNIPESAVGAARGGCWSPGVSLNGQVQRKQPLSTSQLDHFIQVSCLKMALGQQGASQRSHDVLEQRAAVWLGGAERELGAAARM